MIYSYFEEMSRRNRLVIISDGDKPIGWCTVLIGDDDDVIRFYNKPMLSIVDDRAIGNLIYIDKIVCLKWNKSIRNRLYDVLTAAFPFAEKAVWYRPTKYADRKVVLNFKEVECIA